MYPHIRFSIQAKIVNMGFYSDGMITKRKIQHTFVLMYDHKQINKIWIFGEELPIRLLLLWVHTGPTLMIGIVHYVDLVEYFNHE